MTVECINFFKTSNTTLSIKEMVCNYCEKQFYELEDCELDECPLCGGNFGEIEPSENACDDDTFVLIADHRTGVPRILKDGEYEPIIPNESASKECTFRMHNAVESEE